MSKITIDRAVVEQALESLTNCTSEYGHRCSRCDSEVDEGGNVAAALSAALEQPQVEQEPVAWAVTQGGAICWEADYPFSNEPGWCDSDQQSVPLYTHPQTKRQPLTDEQIGEIEGWFSNEFGLEAKHSIDFARAIEAAHGITGEQE